MRLNMLHPSVQFPNPRESMGRRMAYGLTQEGISKNVANFAVVTACTMQLKPERIPGYALALQALVNMEKKSEIPNKGESQ